MQQNETEITWIKFISNYQLQASKKSNLVKNDEHMIE